MKIAGIVAEYNPFHNGHAYHIERTRDPEGGCAATHVAAVMSGNFVQRGELALLPKSDRVRAALAGGVDLVLELPLPWAMSSAENFAYGAVSILDALGCVDVLSFGSECGDLEALARVADTLDSDRFSSLLRYQTGLGISFPEARQKAVAELAGTKTGALLQCPNNTLGIEYLKALRRLGSSITPYTVRRFGAEHDEMAPLGEFASASYLRTLIRSDRLLNAVAFLPGRPAALLSEALRERQGAAEAHRLDRAVLARLRTLTQEEIAALPGISEGLENRVYAAIRQAGSLAELAEAIKTKRYPLTRVQRLIWSAFLGIPASYTGQKPPYIRILGANQKGMEILSAMKQSGRCALPLISRASQAELLDETGRAVWELENRASDLYALALPVPFPCGAECTTGIIREG